MHSNTPADVCVVTTIHGDYDARIYDRGLRVYAEAGLRAAFVGPWPYREDSGIPQSAWRRTWRSPGRALRPLAAVRTFAECLRLPARIYHIHDLDFLPYAVLLKLITRSKVVYDVHENYPEDILHHKPWIPALFRPILAAAVRKLERFAARYLDAVIVVVPYLQDRFRGYGVNPALVQNFSRLDSTLDLAHDRNLLYSGGISQIYGAETLLNIAHELKHRQLPYRLVVVDKFVEPQFRQRFLKAISEDGAPIDIVPLVRPTELARIMRLGAVGLVPDIPTPTAHLGLHAKFFDYMALGLPLIASDLPNARALIQRAQNGVLVPALDAGAFVDAAVAILNDDSEWQRLRENGIEAYDRDYSWKGEVRKLLEVIRSLLAAESADRYRRAPIGGVGGA